jgi:hypothetical protein
MIFFGGIFTAHCARLRAHHSPMTDETTNTNVSSIDHLQDYRGLCIAARGVWCFFAQCHKSRNNRYRMIKTNNKLASKQWTSEED